MTAASDQSAALDIQSTPSCICTHRPLSATAWAELFYPTIVYLSKLSAYPIHDRQCTCSKMLATDHTIIPFPFQFKFQYPS